MYYDVLIIGAGPAGIGIAKLLKDIGVENMMILDKNEVGSSFRRWPAEMRFITPSFTSNFFAQMDLNSIAQGTSPAYTLRTEHPSGAEYAEYLQAAVDWFKLPVRTGVEVLEIHKSNAEFVVRTNEGLISANFCIWAGGEFQFPTQNEFEGADLCQPSSSIRSYKDVKGDEAWIIGGYESGMDAAVNLCKLGKQVCVIDKGRTWDEFSTDPSLNLSTYTYERVKEARASDRLHILSGHEVKKVENVDGKYIIHTHKKKLVATTPPIKATGFKPSPIIKELFETDEDGICLNEWDESTKYENLFLVGPQVRQEGLIFCFIYKFRQRFGVVAKTIGERMGVDMSALIESLRRDGLFLDDLSCCGDECAC